MANLPGTAVIEVRAGTSPTPVKELRPGDQLQPTSIGRNGMWQIDAPGVLDVHAYVYFDGQSLFMQSADPSNPAKGNGQTIGAAWQQIEIPCTIEVGRARLVYRTLEDGDDDDKTVARPLELALDGQMTPAVGSPAAGAPVMQPPAMQFRPPALVQRQDEEEKTRFAPMDFSSGGTPAAGAPRQPEPTVVAPMELQQQSPRARPAAGAPAMGGNPWADGPQQGSTAVAPAPPAPQYQQWGSVQVQGGMQPGMQPGMQQGAYGQPMMQPGMMQPGYGQPGMMQPGMQPGMQGGAYGQPGMMQPGMMPGMQGAPTEQGKVVTATGPMSPIEKFRAELNSLSPIKKIILFLVPIMAILLIREEDQANQPVELPALDAGVALDTGVATPVTTGTTGPTIALPTAMGVIPQPVPMIALDGGQNLTTPKDAGARSVERLAADAVADGKFGTAIQLYDQLAATTPAGPQQDAYRAAAQILRVKVDGG